jgi:hypothetical protein
MLLGCALVILAGFILMSCQSTVQMNATGKEAGKTSPAVQTKERGDKDKDEADKKDAEETEAEAKAAELAQEEIDDVYS